MPALRLIRIVCYFIFFRHSSPYSWSINPSIKVYLNNTIYLAWVKHKFWNRLLFILPPERNVRNAVPRKMEDNEIVLNFWTFYFWTVHVQRLSRIVCHLRTFCHSISNSQWIDPTVKVCLKNSKYLTWLSVTFWIRFSSFFLLEVMCKNPVPRQVVDNEIVLHLSTFDVWAVLCMPYDIEEFHALSYIQT